MPRRRSTRPAGTSWRTRRTTPATSAAPPEPRRWGRRSPGLSARSRPPRMGREVCMHVALLFHHGVRENAPSEVMSHPHVELLASNPHEQERLKLLAGQLAEFGTVPYSYKELLGNDPN